MSTPAKITVSGVPEGYDATALLDGSAASGVPVVYVARDDKALRAMHEALAFFAPTASVVEFPAWDCLPYDRVSPNSAISAARMAALAALSGPLAGKPIIVLTTLSAAMQRVPARALIAGAAFSASVGERVNEEALRAFLVRMGFTQAPSVSEPGDYAIRGGIIDIYPPGQSGPVRLDFFGDTLDGARRFDVETQRTTQKLERVDLAPVSEVILDDAAITRFRQNYRIEFGAAGTDDPLYEAVSAGKKHAGAEHWMSFFYDDLETVFDYLPGASVVLADQIDAARSARWETIADQYDNRREAMLSKGRIDSVYKPAPPEGLYLDDAGWDAQMAKHRVLALAVLPQATGPGVIDKGGRIGRDFAPERRSEQLSLFGALKDHITAERRAAQVVVASYSEGARERLEGLLADEGMEGTTRIADWRDVPEGVGGVFLTVWPLDSGFKGMFQGAVLSVISEQDVLGDRLVAQPKKRRRA
ncbi:MAG: transcription-repair coupling factor, partial [Pseudomonadota bacterium]